MSRGCLQFVIVVFPDHTHLLFLNNTSTMTSTPKTVGSELSMDMSSDKGGKPRGADTKVSKLGDGEPLEKMKKRTKERGIRD